MDNIILLEQTDVSKKISEERCHKHTELKFAKLPSVEQTKLIDNFVRRICEIINEKECAETGLEYVKLTDDDVTSLINSLLTMIEINIVKATDVRMIKGEIKLIENLSVCRDRKYGICMFTKNMKRKS